MSAYLFWCRISEICRVHSGYSEVGLGYRVLAASLVFLSSLFLFLTCYQRRKVPWVWQKPK